MLILLILLISIVLLYAGLYKLFEKAGLEPWKALVPWLNYYHWIKLTGRPMWWWYITFIPVVNMVVFLLMRADLANHFGKRSFLQHLLVWVFPFIGFAWWGFSKNVKYTGYPEKEKKQKSVGREWADAIAFAVIAATIIRTFLLEAFTIPTSSLEKSLMVGDFLFVSKVTYGPKIPNTPISFPFVHHTIPLLNVQSYVEWIKLPYYRLPGLRKVQNNDIVVFNYPDGDTVLSNMQDRSYYNTVLDQANEFRMESDPSKPLSTYVSQAWSYVDNPSNISKSDMKYRNMELQFGEKLARPADKRENYVKRCVAIAGDILEIKDRVLHINGKPAYVPPNLQYSYLLFVKSTGKIDEFFDKHDITDKQVIPDPMGRGAYMDSLNNVAYNIHTTDANFKLLKTIPNIYSITPNNKEKGEWDYDIFPHSPKYPWNVDNFGPLTIPKQGVTVPINDTNIVLYSRIIDVYEENDLEIKDGKVFINGVASNSYTFKMDYFWMMGDNRHNSADSRSWGFVPDDHIVGTPVFIWLSMKDPGYNPVSGSFVFRNIFSMEGKYRWNRMLTFVSRDGLSMSFLLPVLILLIGWYGYKRFRKKKAVPASRKK